MPWVFITDKLHENTKITEASGDAVKLWLLALSWSNDKLTDGHIPARRASMLTAAPKSVIAELVKARLWHPADRPCKTCLDQRAAKKVTDAIPDGGYLIHHYFDFQRPAWAVRSERQKQIEGGRAGAAKRWGTLPEGRGVPHRAEGGTPMGHPIGSPTETGRVPQWGEPAEPLGSRMAPYPRTPVSPEEPISKRTPAAAPEPDVPDGATGSNDPGATRGHGLRHIGEVMGR